MTPPPDRSLVTSPEAASGRGSDRYGRQGNLIRDDHRRQMEWPSDVCSIEGCERPRTSRGWCGLHYARWQRNGDPLLADTPTPRRKGRPIPPLAVRFAERYVVDPSGCWLWTGTITGDGYGRLRVNGRGIGAHRVALMVAGVDIPEGLTVDHLCHTRDASCPGGVCMHRRCVNPDHLELVTGYENIMRGRGSQAENARKVLCNRGHDAWMPHPTKDGPNRICAECKKINDREHAQRRGGVCSGCGKTFRRLDLHTERRCKGRAA